MVPGDHSPSIWAYSSRSATAVAPSERETQALRFEQRRVDVRERHSLDARKRASAPAFPRATLGANFSWEAGVISPVASRRVKRCSRESVSFGQIDVSGLA